MKTCIDRYLYFVYNVSPSMYYTVMYVYKVYVRLVVRISEVSGVKLIFLVVPSCVTGCQSIQLHLFRWLGCSVESLYHTNSLAFTNIQVALPQCDLNGTTRFISACIIGLYKPVHCRLAFLFWARHQVKVPSFFFFFFLSLESNTRWSVNPIVVDMTCC